MPTAPNRRHAADRAALVRGADRRRGSAASRGYDSRWTHYRTWFLESFPACGDLPPGARRTEDSRCRTLKRLTAATVVDHIRPVTGADDPRFYDQANHQALCERCHNAKRQRESQGR